MPFFGDKTIVDAFDIANDKAKIASWFKDFSGDPEKYGIAKEHEESMKNVVTTINKFIDITSPQPFFDDTRVPEPERATAPEIEYRSFKVLVITIFDVIGWVLSVVGTAPGPASDQNKAEYYHPMLTLFGVICRTLLKKKGEADPRLAVEAGMIQITWFQDGDVWRVALGGNLDKPKGDDKEQAKNDRARYMLYTEVITIAQYRDVNLTWVESREEWEHRQGRGQSFGHCAETLPFTFVQWIMGNVHVSTVGGLAGEPKVLLGRLGNIVYDADMKKKFDPVAANVKTALAPPCPNCSKIVVEKFGGDSALPRFQTPTL